MYKITSVIDKVFVFFPKEKADLLRSAFQFIITVYDTVFAAASVYTDAEFASCAKTYSTYLKNLSDGEEKKNFNTYVKDEKLLEKLNKDDPYYNVDVDDVLKSNKLSNKEILLIALLSVAAITALTVCVILFVKKLSKRTDSKGK